MALQHPHQLEVGAGEDGDLGLDPELAEDQSEISCQWCRPITAHLADDEPLVDGEARDLVLADQPRHLGQETLPVSLR